MKKTISMIILAVLLPIIAAAQTKYISPSKDTLIINTTVPAPIPVTTVVFKAYKPPVTTPPVATTGNTQTVAVGGTISGPVTLQSNKLYQNLTIDLGKTSASAFTGNNVSGFTIKKCKILNGSGSGFNWAAAIFLQNCSNFTIDSVSVNGVPQGFHFKSCYNYKVTNNQFFNIIGSPTLTLHPINIENCNGGGQRIMNNRIEEIAADAPFTHDQISIYNSNGIPGDSIMITGNWIRGGQQVKNAAGNNGACAIGVGDSGGSYQVVRNNILVNALAIAIDGTGTSLKIDHNKIYALQIPPQPLAVGILYFGKAGNNYVGFNQVNFTGPNGIKAPYNINQLSGTLAGWDTNTFNAEMNAGILPVTIVTMK